MQAVRSKDRDSDDTKSFKCRRKVNPNSPPTAVEIHGIRVHFPFRPYNCQEIYMTKVMEALIRSENALLESPTGTGKTLCLLCACLAWQREEARRISQMGDVGMNLNAPPSEAETKSKHSRVPVIVYASRTHSQLSQVVRELRNTRYRPSYAVLGSREQMCVNPKVKKANATAFDINHDCSKLCKERKCRFRNGLEGFVAPANEEGTGDSLDHPVMDMEDLIAMGKRHNVCPFYYSRSQLEKAELVLVPYNYLFDKDARTSSLSDVPWENAVVIFDEAHNLESFASDSASFDLTVGDVAGCVAEVDKAVNYVRSMPELKNDFQLKEENMLRIKDIFLKLEDHICNHIGTQTAYSGEFIMEIFKKGAGITYSNHAIFIEEVGKINNLLMDIRGSIGRGAPRIEHFVQCLKRVFGHPLESKCYAKAAFYRVYVSPKVSSNNQKREFRTVSYWCFAPSVAMEEIAGLKVRSILVTSGTLSPLPSYSMELGLTFHHTLENPHIISDEQVHVRIVGKGVSGKVLNSSFERRKDSEYFTELGNTIASLAKVTPAGMLVFFPSYSVMETCIERWGGPASNKQTTRQANAPFFRPRSRQSGNTRYSFPQAPSSYYESSSPGTPWKRLLTTKAVVIEPKSSSDLPDAIAEFKRYLALPKSSGCVLMGVCRGKISEGIDFAHEQSRAVVITGLPFAPSHDPKVVMKREFLDGSRLMSLSTSRNDGGFGVASLKGSHSQLSGLEWYTQQAHRAVNQAIGRVIRNVSDFGAVLLLDSRFEQTANQEGLSKWLRPHIQRDEGFGTAIRVLAKFYKEASVKANETAAKLSPQLLELEYQAEEQLDELSGDASLSKVAVIRPAANPSGQMTHGNEVGDKEPTNYVPPDRVLATLDMKELQKRPLSPSTNVVAGEAKKAKASNDAVFEASRPTSTRASSENPVATRFFERARQKLSQTELCSIKEAIVAMRDYGQKRNTSGFIAAAGDLIKKIVRCDGLEQFNGMNTDSNMLLLFLRLLPPEFKGDVTIMAMKYTFDKSLLANICKENLPSGCFRHFRTLVVALLQDVWCSELSGVDSSYLSKVESFLRVVLKSGKVGMNATVNALIKLLPMSHISCTRTLGREMVAALKIDRMRAADKGKCIGLAPTDCDASPKVAARMKKSFICPQGSIPEVQSESTGETIVPSKFKPTSALALKPRHPRITLTKTSLESLIKEVESDTYVQQNLADFAKKIPNHTGEALTCPVCSTSASEPFMAECGHVACLSCWKEWLSRSETCPSCRASTSIESIARVVFENRPGVGVPQSLSQLMNASVPKLGDTNDESTSEDELEIC